jgi:hypothetical protein
MQSTPLHPILDRERQERIECGRRTQSEELVLRNAALFSLSVVVSTNAQSILITLVTA